MHRTSFRRRNGLAGKATRRQDLHRALRRLRRTTVRFIDSTGQIHLEETGLALIPGVDEYEILK